MSEEINQGHYFEIMDRVHVIQENIELHLRNHPATQESCGWVDLIDNIQAQLSALSGMAAKKHDLMEKDSDLCIECGQQYE